MLKGSYDEKCDVWSAGVILYIILCGYPPFYGETNKEILEQVKKGKLDFTGPEWKDKSADVLDLIKKMVCETECRYSAQEVLAHKWMNPKASMNELTNVGGVHRDRHKKYYERTAENVRLLEAYPAFPHLLGSSAERG